MSKNDYYIEKTHFYEVNMRVTEGQPAAESKVKEFANDLTTDTKNLVLAHVTEEVAALLEEPQLTINDLAHLAFVTHGSIKSRSKNAESANAILTSIINKERATRPGKAKIKDFTSAKSFLASLPAAEYEALMEEIRALKK